MKLRNEIRKLIKGRQASRRQRREREWSRRHADRPSRSTLPSRRVITLACPHGAPTSPDASTRHSRRGRRHVGSDRAAPCASATRRAASGRHRPFPSASRRVARASVRYLSVAHRIRASCNVASRTPFGSHFCDARARAAIKGRVQPRELIHPKAKAKVTTSQEQSTS